MNRKGQFISFFFLLMMGIVLFILGFALAPVLVTNSTAVMGFIGCSTTSDVSEKIICTTIDMVAPFVTGVIFGLGGIVIGAKLTGR